MDELLPTVSIATLTTKKTPLLVEVSVHGSGAPFLVSGTRDWVWVEGARTGVLRAAVRSGKVSGDLSLQIVSEVVRRGVLGGWKNVFSFTEDGVKQAISYVRFYGIEDVELLVPIGYPFPAMKGVSIVPVSWIPSNRVVVVPSDRSYLGMIGTLGDTHWMVAVHNPSRGMAVSGDW